ncbi:bifunctional diguanylate cyclase/phosphodiesterase [Acuticoccus mangrovi]|uniref:EAL domain-containing protein n=1 Tax=Acuticoccus mangrovi TaxID=2796142 RepID=A0A934IP30_9HYPH|nr:EAL domain-containing protein [Acuticoccus mangrovi]MBJ3776135.1 EAL domain-containing protein [Acuticoccus mangrovi]
MLRLASCVAFGHNLALVGLAVVLCLVGSAITARLLRRVIASYGHARLAWIALGAIAAGCTIWCTHFIAMLGYVPGVVVTYDPTITLVSLLLAIVGCFAAFGMASEKLRYAAPLGGAAFGVAIAAMHYCGMMALAVNGTVEWSPVLVVVSIVLSVLFGVAAFSQIARSTPRRAVLVGAGLLSLTIVALHFTGMAALSIYPNAPAAGDIVDDVARGLIAFAVTGIGLLLLFTGAISYFLDAQAQEKSSSQLRHLTQSAVDGMAVVQDERIVEANAALERMTGMSRAELLGRSMGEFLLLPSALPQATLLSSSLTRAAGESIPVEFAVHTEAGTTDGRPLTVFSLRDMSQRLAQEKRIVFLAEYDSLTGLRNRASFLEQCTAVLHWNASPAHFAVLAIDLNRFKEVNDTYGHAAGDRVLRTAGMRLKDALDRNQMAARLGGDEFAVFAKVHSKEEAIALAERIDATFSKPVEFEGALLQCHASIGMALYPNDGDEVTVLINNADLAMYRAKASGGDHICLYDKAMDDTARMQRRLVDDMRQAIARNELELHYQVQIRLPAEEAVSYEALVRWRHPERGLVPPNDFIPLAEQSGLIVKLGEWVLRTACAEAAAWPSQLPVSVNLSPLQLVAPNFVAKLKSILEITGMDPKRLELEVTESCFIADGAKAGAVLHAVKQLGVSISMDDFGAGYSSLAMLNSFPFDKIKLDRSLIEDLNSSEKSKGIVRAILSLGTALDVPVIAEGVETIEQLNYLCAEGCVLIQGYYYGRPERHLATRGLLTDDETAQPEGEVTPPNLTVLNAGHRTR